MSLRPTGHGRPVHGGSATVSGAEHILEQRGIAGPLEAARAALSHSKRLSETAA
jgi:hypothetical protein